MGREHANHFKEYKLGSPDNAMSALVQELPILYVVLLSPLPKHLRAFLSSSLPRIASSPPRDARDISQHLPTFSSPTISLLMRQKYTTL